MIKNTRTSYVIEFTQRTTRVLRSLDVDSGRMKIDIKDTTMPFDTRIVDAWVCMEDGVLWLEHETEGEQTVKIRLAKVLRWSRQPRW
ncbi:hypothetical protein [Janthinobacterium sp. 64]|uniref:hypothetical protein n=1 Tax=Janthinobacterium sp. 64 TaxID=2035208 RepID=UPI000C2C1C77|nr:hypothetical protein [Janthinobacterium sp. 64]